MKNNTFDEVKSKLNQIAPLALRIVMGYGFMVHGWAKLNHGRPVGFQKLLEQMNVPFPSVSAWLVPLVEMIGGLAILIGAFTALAAVPLIIVMLVAMFKVHLKFGFSSIKTIGLSPDGPIFGPPGYEVDLLYIAGLIALILGGAGILSVDSMFRKRKATAQ
ncbi:MAG TPA: DoxX family protein [Verrucomicrobiae bacterium]|jgi:Predicted membrane protein